MVANSSPPGYSFEFPSLVLQITADFNDANGKYGIVLIRVTGGNVTFTLPAANRVAGKTYLVCLVSSAGNNGYVGPAGTDTISLSGSAKQLTVGALTEFVSDGVSNWAVGVAVSTAYTLPNATLATVGGVQTDGNEPIAPAQVPGLGAGGKVAAGVLPIATGVAFGAVETTGTPATASTPIVPVVETGGKIPAAVYTNTVYTLPAATAAANGGVEISGTPNDAAHPVVPVVESGGTIPTALLDTNAIAASSDNTNAIDAEFDLRLPTSGAGGKIEQALEATGGVVGSQVTPVIIPLAKLTTLGTAGSITVASGLIVGHTDPT